MKKLLLLNLVVASIVTYAGFNQPAADFTQYTAFVIYAAWIVAGLNLYLIVRKWQRSR